MKTKSSFSNMQIYLMSSENCLKQSTKQSYHLVLQASAFKSFLIIYNGLLLFNKIMITTCLSHCHCTDAWAVHQLDLSFEESKSPGWKLQWFKHQQTTNWRHLCCRDRVIDWGKWVSAEIQAAVHPTCQSASSNYSYQWSHLPVTITENLASIVPFMDSGISTKCVYIYVCV